MAVLCYHLDLINQSDGILRGDQGIHVASFYGNTHVLANLLSLGCNLARYYFKILISSLTFSLIISPGHGGNSILHYAAKSANLETVRYCLGQGMQVNR